MDRGLRLVLSGKISPNRRRGRSETAMRRLWHSFVALAFPPRRLSSSDPSVVRVERINGDDAHGCPRSG
jgi:hypothetical protein